MSEDKTEAAPAAAPSSAGLTKLLIPLVGATLLLTVANTALLFMNPTAGKVEQFNEQMKSDVEESVGSLHKKLDGLRSAEVEWQSVLKKASEKPNAVYKIVLTPDGLLTLTEITPAPAQ